MNPKNLAIIVLSICLLLSVIAIIVILVVKNKKSKPFVSKMSQSSTTRPFWVSSITVSGVDGTMDTLGQLMNKVTMVYPSAEFLTQDDLKILGQYTSTYSLDNNSWYLDTNQATNMQPYGITAGFPSQSVILKGQNQSNYVWVKIPTGDSMDMVNQNLKSNLPGYDNYLGNDWIRVLLCC
jgi:hypothetical protein